MPTGGAMCMREEEGGKAVEWPYHMCMWSWREIQVAREGTGTGFKNATAAKASAETEVQDINKEIAQKLATVSAMAANHKDRPAKEAELQALRDKLAQLKKPRRTSGDATEGGDEVGAGTGGGGGGAKSGATPAPNAFVMGMMPLFDKIGAQLAENPEAAAAKRAHESEERDKQRKHELELAKIKAESAERLAKIQAEGNAAVLAQAIAAAIAGADRGRGQ